MNRLYKQIYNKIQSAQKILLIPHQNPDGDALGSVSAMLEFLLFINKDVKIFCSTGINEEFNFLKKTLNYLDSKKVWSEKFDLIIVLDSSDLKYAGIDKFITNNNNIINIDHHKTNLFFGKINLVNPQAASTTEILFNFFTFNKIDITHKIATYLLLGLITDTGNFTNPATNKNNLKIAGQLLQLGADLKEIKNNIIINKSINSLKIIGLILSRLEKNTKFDVVYTYLNDIDLKLHNVKESETSILTNLLNYLDEGKMAMFLKYKTNDNLTRVSLRTTRDDYDVSEISRHFGGGGHQKAAGFGFSGNIQQTLEAVWNFLAKKQQKS